jgi:hypothetical protein
MKISISQLLSAAWTVSEVDENYHQVESEVTDDYEGVEVVRIPAISKSIGFIKIRSAIEKCDVCISFSWEASGDTSGTFSDLYNFSITALGEGFVNYRSIFSESSFTLVDEDDTSLSIYSKKFDDFLQKIQSQWVSRVLEVCPKESGPEKVDNTETAAKQFIIDRDNDRSLSFSGVLISSSSGKIIRDSLSLSLHVELYKTVGGKYVAVTRKFYAREDEIVNAMVCRDTLEVQAFLGFNKVTKCIYTVAGMDYLEMVD